MWKKNKKQEPEYDYENDLPMEPEEEKKWYIRMFEPKEDKMENANRQILQMAVIFAGLFLCLIVYLVKFQL